MPSHQEEATYGEKAQEHQGHSRLVPLAPLGLFLHIHSFPPILLDVSVISLYNQFATEHAHLAGELILSGFLW
jgi:hypothetical protein